MAAKKKRKAKRKTPTTKKPASMNLAKLDPTLLLCALRANRETKKKRVRLSKSRLAQLPLTQRIRVGVQSVSSRLSGTSARNFRRRDLIPVVIDSSDCAKTADQVERWRGDCIAVGAGKMCARVPRQKLLNLSEIASVRYVEAGVRLRPHSDLAHRSANLLPASGFNRNVGETGRGVLVGVIDTGIDLAHPAFKTSARTRIVNYLDQERNREFSAADIDAGGASGSLDTIGHGTHVAGIAAGNGRGSPNSEWAGVAPNADLAVVKTSFMSTDIALAVNHIFAVADSRDQPCVINLSLGGHGGGHDGSSITERIIDDLSGPGRLVVISAGNEGGDNIHASTVLRRDTTDRWVADMNLSPQLFDTESGPQQFGYLVVQVWSQSEDTISIQLRTPNGQLLTPAPNGQSEIDQGVFFVEMNHQVHPYSGDNVTTFTVITTPEPAWLNGWSLIATPSGNIEVGAVHAWINDRSMGSFTQGATDDYLVGMPGTAFSAITVASYATRNRWPSRDPNQADGTFFLDAVNLEDISYFSSPGPTRDGQNKPDIAAPGQYLLAPLSADAPAAEMPDWLRVSGRKYASLQGTSMSAPYVTGSLALLLEKAPQTDWAEAKRRLIKSAATDRHTRVCWNPRWGYGRVDIERLLTIEP